MDYITLIKRPLTEVLMATKETRYYLLGLQNAFGHVHIKIKNHHFAALLLGLTKSRLNAVLAFNALAVT